MPHIALLACGNPSRGDDALGPLFMDAIVLRRAARPHWPDIETISDFQLQVEHATDLERADLVLFVDADAAGTAPARLTRLRAEADVGYTTHALPPAKVLAVFERFYDRPAPPAFLLALYGERFELGEALTAAAKEALDAGLALTEKLFAQAELEAWQALSDQGT